MELNFKEIDIIYNQVLRDINRYETPLIPYKEFDLQHNKEREVERKKEHLENLKNNADYNYLLNLKKKIENIKISVNIEGK